MKSSLIAAALLLCAAPLAGAPALARPASASPSSADIATYAETLLRRNYPADGPGAAILVAKGDRVLFRGARGLANLESRTPLRPDSVFRIGSVTKQFAAAGLLKLVEAGKVKLDDPLSKFLPDYPGGERITVLQLLNHTSGVRSYTRIGGYMDEPIRRDLTTAQMLGVFRDLPADFEPGADWAYNNSGYVLVGAVIEAVTGKPWHVYLDEALFTPLGMASTGYALDPRLAPRIVGGYSAQDGKVTAMRPMSMTQPHAAGSLVSTVDDLLKWTRALHAGRVLGREAYTRMVTPEGPAAKPGVGYGFGLFIGQVRSHKLLWHNGGIFGFASSLYYLPGPDITVVVLENDDVSNPLDTHDIIARKLAAMAAGEPYPEMKAVDVDPAVLTTAEGVYRFEGDVHRVLRMVHGKLTAQRGNNPRALLTPIGPDDFLYEDGFNRLQLVRDAAGRITGVRFFAGGDGAGELGLRTDEPLPAAPVGLQLPRPAMERLAGGYADGDLSLKVFMDGDRLKAQLAGQEPVTLRAVSATRFEVEETAAVLEFSEGSGPSAQVTVSQGRRTVTMKRAP